MTVYAIGLVFEDCLIRAVITSDGIKFDADWLYTAAERLGVEEIKGEVDWKGAQSICTFDHSTLPCTTDSFVPPYAALRFLEDQEHPATDRLAAWIQDYAVPLLGRHGHYFLEEDPGYIDTKRATKDELWMWGSAMDLKRKAALWHLRRLQQAA